MFDPIYAVLFGVCAFIGTVALYYAARAFLFFVLNVIATAHENSEK